MNHTRRRHSGLTEFYGIVQTSARLVVNAKTLRYWTELIETASEKRSCQLFASILCESTLD